MRILTICPSKRPQQLKEMLASFYSTASISDIIVSKEDINITKIFNNILHKNPDYDYYHLVNDDVIYHTKCWDTQLAGILEDYGDGIAYGNDLLQGENLPTFPLISASIVKALGWIQMPKLEYLYGDNVWKDIGERADCLYYDDSVIIEHRHMLKTKQLDEVYKKTNHKTQRDKDRFAYVQWLANQSNDDIVKVRKAIDGGEMEVRSVWGRG